MGNACGAFTTFVRDLLQATVGSEHFVGTKSRSGAGFLRRDCSGAAGIKVVDPPVIADAIDDNAIADAIIGDSFRVSSQRAQAAFDLQGVVRIAAGAECTVVDQRVSDEFRGLARHGSPGLVFKVSSPGEDHGDAMSITGCDHLVVIFGSARLNNSADAGLCCAVDRVGEGKECIAREHATGEFRFGFSQGDFDRINATHLAGSRSP